MGVAYKRASRGPVAGRLVGKVVVISGTGGGQGRAAALLFARAVHLPEFKRHFEGWPLLARGGEADDVAYTALFLASDESAWITGVNIAVDGGMSCKTGVTVHG